MGIGYVTGLIVIDFGNYWRTPSQVITEVNSELAVNNFQSLIPKGVEVRAVPSLEPTGANFEEEEPYDIYSRAYIDIWGAVENIKWTDFQIMIKNILMRISHCNGLYVDDVIFKIKLEDENHNLYDKIITEVSFNIDYET